MIYLKIIKKNCCNILKKVIIQAKNKDMEQDILSSDNKTKKILEIINKEKNKPHISSDLKIQDHDGQIQSNTDILADMYHYLRREIRNLFQIIDQFPY